MDHSIGWRAELISLSPFRHISLEGICFHCRFYGFTVHWYSTLIHTKRIDMPFSIFIEGQGSRSACLCWQIFSVSLASVALKFSLKNAFYSSTQTNIFCAYAKAIFLLISSEHLLPQFTFLYIHQCFDGKRKNCLIWTITGISKFPHPTNVLSDNINRNNDYLNRLRAD